MQAPAASVLAPRGRSKPTFHRRVDQWAREGRAATCCTAPVPVNKKCLLCAAPPQVPPTAPGLATAVPTYRGGNEGSPHALAVGAGPERSHRDPGTPVGSPMPREGPVSGRDSGDGG